MTGFAAGTEFAGYVIDRQLGAGGMGEVYLARHPRLPRHDALKVLAPQFSSDPHYRARFEREAEAAAGLSHPAIVAVHDRGEADGRLWIAMAYVDGEDLAHRVRRTGPLAANQVAMVVSVVGDALDRANSRGLVHRDVKPANILLSSDGDVLLTDFGIARSTLTPTELTATGHAVGTVDYASPEQLQGMAVDGRTDQYSLACTAFALLTGRAPFAASSAARVISSQLNDPLPSVLPLRPDVTPAVDAVLARATAKDPAQRFSSSTEFATALGSALAQPPVAHASAATMEPAYAPTAIRQPGHAPMPARPPARSRRTGRIVAAVVIAVVAFLVAAGVGIWYAIPTQWKTSEGDYTIEPTDAARDYRDLADATVPLTSLEEKPTASPWTYRPVPKRGPFGSSEVPVVVAGAAGESVLMGREGALDIVDVTTGKLIKSVSIGGTDMPWKCGAGESARAEKDATWVACGFAGSPHLVMVDVRRGAVLGTAEMPLHGEDFAVIGDRVVAAGGSGDAHQVTVFDNRGRTVWERESRKPVAIGGPVVGIGTKPTGSAFDTKEVVAVRVSDGKDVARTDKPAKSYDSEPEFRPYAGGFVLGGHFYDVNGQKLASVPGNWSAMYTPMGLATVALPLPLMANLDDEVGVVDPKTGEVLWARKLKGAYSAHASAIGQSGYIGNMASRQQFQMAMYKVTTGEGGQWSAGDVRSALGTDGSRVAVQTAEGLEVFGPDSAEPIWTLPLSATDSRQLRSAAGHIFLGGEMIL